MIPHQLPAQVAHVHLTVDEVRACEADHTALMQRLADPQLAYAA